MDELKKDLLRAIFKVATKEEILSYLSEFENEQKPVAKPAKHLNLRVGMYAFAGEKFSDNPKAFDNLLGIVAWVNHDPKASRGQRALILTLEEDNLIWSDALDYCLVYNLHDVKSGRGFLPTKEQWQSIYVHVDVINKALKSLNVALLDQLYSSSSLYGYSCIWAINMKNGELVYKSKAKNLAVRCCLPY